MSRVRGTAAYLALLLATHIAVFRLVSPATKDDILRAISTNLADMTWTAPLRLVGSALVADTSGTILDNILVIGLGIAVCLSALERRLGTLRAFSIFATAHVLVTLIVLAVVAVATHTGRYPDEIRYELDYGVSFGALGAIGAVTYLLPKWLRIPWAAIAVLYPLTAADWYGLLPDYSTLGHALSAATGVALSWRIVRSAPARARGDSGSGSGSPVT
ncbi:rhomboid-like protein [Actinomadura sp. 9N407]|uniref:rhomboid-like protein n=1 Tax=Actinomadura sp. 9N407 TaxID=3375154 RepID=UPI00379E089B